MNKIYVLILRVINVNFTKKNMFLQLVSKLCQSITFFVLIFT